MAFNISQFKSELDKYGGAARTSLFEVIISPTSGGTTSVDSDKKLKPSEFSFFCKTASIPAVSINTNEMTNVGQLNKMFPIGVNNEPMACVFMVDSDHQVLNYFHQWMQKIVNHGSGGGPFNMNGDFLPYEIGYKSDYAVEITIRHYSTESIDSKYYEVVLSKAYPTMIGELQLSWEENDSYLSLPVSFSYDKIQFSGTKTGTPNERASRGTGLLDTLGAIAGFGSVVNQTIDQGFKFDSIQDAINRITRVNSSLTNITNKI